MRPIGSLLDTRPASSPTSHSRRRSPSRRTLAGNPGVRMSVRHVMLSRLRLGETTASSCSALRSRSSTKVWSEAMGTSWTNVDPMTSRTM